MQSAIFSVASTTNCPFFELIDYAAVSNLATGFGVEASGIKDNSAFGICFYGAFVFEPFGIDESDYCALAGIRFVFHTVIGLGQFNPCQAKSD